MIDINSFFLMILKKTSYKLDKRRLSKKTFMYLWKNWFRENKFSEYFTQRIQNHKYRC